MYIWRFPLFAVADILTTVALLVNLSVFLRFRRRAISLTIRGLYLAAAVVGVGLSPALVSALIVSGIHAEAARGRYVDPSSLVFVLPAAFAIAICLLAFALFPGRPWRRQHLWRGAFAAASVAAVGLNVTNWCAPGWCNRFGFPLPYSRWSDAQLTLNGTNYSAGTSYAALLVNGGVFVVVAVVASRSYRRRVSDRVNGRPTSESS